MVCVASPPSILGLHLLLSYVVADPASSGECAGHFRQILNKYPPQVKSRSTAAAWACHVHNQVNKSLKKELFDCSKIGDFYDCGCAEEPEEAGPKSSEPPGLKLEREG